ncbi:hypothetical protein Q8791_05530 [Nocardiopsis sp. CT-R113]|uniref:TetR family transcriptional regulator n=1 Tax=Nocardiopsis codii TaxID=3065942 RepID=A0ABU7K3B6_9ACTN|nr:hypothetical protein [Nocardiopsis sp. CT-R113]MEE2036685.1 hypothetical protein [Nocardiopsis sp. CT-R113]
METASVAEARRELMTACATPAERAARQGRLRPGLPQEDLLVMVCGVEHAVRVSSRERGEATALYVETLLEGLLIVP